MLASTISILCIGLFAPYAGHLVSRFSIRLLMAGAIVLLAAALCLIAAANTMWQITALYALPVAAGLVLTGPLAAQTLAVNWFRARRGLAIGVVTMGRAVGGLLMPPIVAYLLAAYGWRAAHLALAGFLCAVLLPLVIVLVRNGPADRGLAPGPQEENAPADSDAEQPAWTSGQLLRDRTLWGVAIWAMFMIVAYSGFSLNLASYANDLGGTPKSTALLLVLLNASAIAGTCCIGALADRIDLRFLALGVLVVELGGLAILATGAGYQTLSFLIVPMGFVSGGGIVPIVGATIARRFGKAAFGRALGLANPLIMLGGVGAVAAGYARDSFGSYDAAFGALLLVGIPCCFGIALMKTAPHPGEIPAGAARVSA